MPDGAKKLHPRAARSKLVKAQACLAHLEAARRAQLGHGGDCSAIDEAIVRARNEVLKLAGWAEERMEPRRRVPVVQRTEHSPPRRRFLIFLDECGVHTLDPDNDPFPVFCLSAVLIDAEKYLAVDRAWKTWKATWLGSWQHRVHEPDARRRSHFFHHDDPATEQALIDSLAGQLAALDFTCVSAVIDKRSLKELYPDGKVDDFLPSSTYLMCVDFVFERVVHFLYHEGEDALGDVTAESRGLREDAEVQSEFLRLHLEGTQFLAEQFFRNQLRPHIEFERKEANLSGLQIADLVARPIAEKALNRETTPDRWQAIAPKLYDGGAGRRGSYGLKVFPGPGAAEIFGEVPVKANEDA
jgi:hypothetical protein